MKKDKKFSAFKLFYDEFVYKEDKTLKNISRNIELIRSSVLKIRNTSPLDKEYYMMILNRCNHRIQCQLDEIYSLNPYVFEYYYMLYKTRVLDTNEQVKDMPFIISCSFYDDYRLDDKSFEELSNSDYVIPKYNSLEKKNIRTEAKKGSQLLFILNLIKEHKDGYRFQRLVSIMNEMFHDLKPNGESHYDYIGRVEESIGYYQHVFVRELNKLSGTLLELDLKEKMEIVYRKRPSFDYDFLVSLIKEHFDMLYQEYMENGNLIKNYMTGNSISYASYKEVITTLTKEKNQYLKIYLKGTYESVVSYDTSDISRFKTTLMNAYFDIRYMNQYYPLDTVEDYVRRAIDFYDLSEVLEVQLFEKVSFDSSHSKKLGRNNDVNSAIMEKIYYLYDFYPIFFDILSPILNAFFFHLMYY